MTPGYESAGIQARNGARMFNRLARTLVKVLIASLIVGTILAHFGITTDELIKTAGLSRSHWRFGARWLRLGATQPRTWGAGIVPVWFVLYLFRPPGGAGTDRFTPPLSAVR